MPSKTDATDDVGKGTLTANTDPSPGPRIVGYAQNTEGCELLGEELAELDLLQQCRMAVSTEQVEKWRRIGPLISLGGFGAFIFALYLDMKATKETGRSADALILFTNQTRNEKAL